MGTLLLVGSTVGLVYGCSAAGNAAGVGDDTGNAPDGSSSTPPADYGTGDNNPPSDAAAPVDSGKKTDAGTKTDGGKTTGPVKPAEGSACDPSTALSSPDATETCGLCGTQNRACLADSSVDGGYAWAAWSPCTGEVTAADKCDPSITYPSTACGNCGTTPQVCGSDCHFETGFTCTEPANACTPGDTTFVLGSSCTASGQGRVYTCSATCAYGSPSACQDPPPNPNSLTISATVGDEVTKNFELTSANTTGKISGISCPASVSTSTTVQNLWISIVNPTTRTVTVGLWDGPQVSTDPKVDTIMAWYPTPVVPKTAADQKACTSINDECGTSGAECAGSPWSNLSTTNAASIPA
ncbi:MAG TPA: hypothetical protein VF407_17700, partial [Polyangiaceae bacterium]